MKNQIKKLIAVILLTLGTIFVSLAQTHYEKTVRTQGKDILIDSLAINKRPRGPEFKKTRILAKNGIEFAITFPEKYQNLSIVRNDTNIVIEGRKIKVIGPGHLSFEFTYTENGVSYTCDILGDVNYYGELKYRGETNLRDNPIVVTNGNKKEYLSIPQALSSVEWMLYRNVFEEDKQTINYDQLAECQNTTFSRKNVISFNELLTLKSDKIINGKLELLVLFEDHSSNALPNGVPGGTSVQAITLKDARTYRVNLSQDGQGRVSSSKSELRTGETATLTAETAQDWRFDHWEENGQNVTENPLTITMGTQDRSIKAVFTELPKQKVNVILQIVDTNGGELAPSQSQEVTSGGSVTFQVPNLANVNFKGWKRNGQIVETGSSYTLSNVTQNETIQAIFEVPVQSITVTPASITAKVGEGPIQLTATVLPANATNKTVTWTSKNEQVVKVDSSGKVTIIGAGETAIEAKAGEKTFTVQVKIEAQSQPQQPQPQQPQEPQNVPVQSITVTPTSITAKVGEGPIQLTATVLPANATSKTVTWTSKNEQVVKVDSSGKVTIIGAGDTAIEAKAGEKTFTVQVKIEAQPQQPQPQEPQVVPVQSVTVTPTSITAKVGEGPVQLTATVLPANATSKTVTWTSKNEQVVKVDSSGKVTIIGAGETAIEAKAGEKTFTVQVKIEAQSQPQQPQPQQPQNPKVLVESLSLSFAELSLKVGEAKDLPSVTITPSNATDQAITWISNKPEVAKVENGKVVGVSSGTVQIIASSTNSKTAMLNVTVTPENQVEEEDFPPYVKELPNFKVGQVVNLDDLVWERRDGIEIEEYLLLDTEGKLLPLGTEYQREANKLTFSAARVFVLVVKFKQNARNWQQVEFTIEVKP